VVGTFWPSIIEFQEATTNCLNKFFACATLNSFDLKTSPAYLSHEIGKVFFSICLSVRDLRRLSAEKSLKVEVCTCNQFSFDRDFKYVFETFKHRGDGLATLHPEYPSAFQPWQVSSLPKPSEDLLHFHSYDVFSHLRRRPCLLP